MVLCYSNPKLWMTPNSPPPPPPPHTHTHTHTHTDTDTDTHTHTHTQLFSPEALRGLINRYFKNDFLSYRLLLFHGFKYFSYSTPLYERNLQKSLINGSTYFKYYHKVNWVLPSTTAARVNPKSRSRANITFIL